MVGKRTNVDVARYMYCLSRRRGRSGARGIMSAVLCIGIHSATSAWSATTMLSETCKIPLTKADFVGHARRTDPQSSDEGAASLSGRCNRNNSRLRPPRSQTNFLEEQWPAEKATWNLCTTINGSATTFNAFQPLTPSFTDVAHRAKREELVDVQQLIGFIDLADGFLEHTADWILSLETICVAGSPGTTTPALH